MPIHSLFPIGSFILSLPATTDDILMDFLQPIDLVHYLQTCKANYFKVISYIQRRFKLARLLARFFTVSQIAQFRHLQATHGVLISGSTALQFFHRVVFQESDLDLYVSRGHHRELVNWLTDNGYFFTGDSADELGKDNRIVEENISDTVDKSTEQYPPGNVVVTFVKNDPFRKVQVVITVDSPLACVLKFHSTCVTNIITHDTAYALFPRATFNDLSGLIQGTSTDHEKCALEKYQRRGWSLRGSAHLIDIVSAELAPGVRYIGDARTWRIPILPKMTMTHERFDITTNSWRILYNQMRQISMVYCLFVSPTLQFGYTIDNIDDHLFRHMETYLLENTVWCDELIIEHYLDEGFMDIVKWYRDHHRFDSTCYFLWAKKRWRNYDITEGLLEFESPRDYDDDGESSGTEGINL